MEIDVKHRNQRNRRRERAQRMQAERDRDVDGGDPDSAEDENIQSTREKHPRPPIRRKKTLKEPSPLLEEDIIDGFAICSFKSYEDLEFAIKVANKNNESCITSELNRITMVEEKPPKIDSGQREKDRDRDNRDRERDWNFQNHNHISNNIHTQHNIMNHNTHNVLTIAQDPSTSDDSGRASERLTSSSVAPRDPDSSRDRLSDASSRCSSGKGYICDSEGDDDRGSDGGSVVFASTPTQVPTTTPSPAAPRKSDFPAIAQPLSNGPIRLGGNASPVPIPLSSVPAPSTTPATLPPPSLPPPYPSPMQDSNGPISTHGAPISSHSNQTQTPIGKLTVQPTSKVPPTSSSSMSPSSKNQNLIPSSPSVPSTQTLEILISTPLIANGYNSSIPPMMSTHSAAAPRISSSPNSNNLGGNVHQNSNQNSNSLNNNNGSINGILSTPPSSLPVAVPQQLPAAAPSGPPAITHAPGLDSATAASGRTNSPAVATSAVPPAAAPTLNGNIGAPMAATNGNIPPYRLQYQNYPLYAPYSNLQHSPYLPPAVPSPAASPRTIDSRANRESPLVASSKSVRPITPSSTNSSLNNSMNSITSPASQPGLPGITTSNLREQQHHQSQNLSHPLAVQTSVRTHSPRGHSPTRERDSYSSSVSSLSRSSATPGSGAPYGSGSSGAPPGPSPALPYCAASSVQSPIPTSLAGSSSLSYPKMSVPSPWPSSSSSQISSVPNTTMTRPTPPPVPVSMSSLHSVSTPSSHAGFPPPLFAAPLPPPAVPTTTTAPHPFSGEVLFQPNQTDLLRRELDNRFLDRTGMSGVPPSPYLRQELHHHQHQHTHLHQHQPLLSSAPPSAAPLFPPPLFKDINKIGAVESPFYRTGLGMPAYPGYTPSLLHPGLSGSTTFVPPTHLPNFAPKQPTSAVDPSKPKQVKTGKWNAMHVRIAWEIYHHQTKGNSDKTATPSFGVKSNEMLRPPHIFPSVTGPRPHELQGSAFPPSGLPGRPPYETAPMPSSFLGAPSHIGSGLSPFGRYGAPFSNSPFNGLSPFTRDIPLGAQLSAVPDPWRAMPRAVGGTYPPPSAQSWALKPDPSIEARREAEERERDRERERERQRREREERERQQREKEEKLRKEQQEREQRERERERREREKRDMERREIERERLIQQQRIAESNKLAAAANVQRDRSPLRNGNDPDIRVKEEPRKDEELMIRADPRYHPANHAAFSYMASRHGQLLPPPPHLARNMMSHAPLGAASMSHFPPPPGPGWPASIDPYRDPYRIDPMHQLRYMEVIRAEEERVKAMNSVYAAHSAAHLRSKEPSPIPPHHRMPPGSLKPPSSHHGIPTNSLPVSVDMHKKDDQSQPR